MEAKLNTTVEYNSNDFTFLQHISSNKSNEYAKTDISSIKKQDFKTTTELIARRIVSKQLEFSKKGGCLRKECLHKPDIAVKLNNVVVQRILHVHMKESKNKKSPEASRSRSSSPTRSTSGFSVASKHSGKQQDIPPTATKSPSSLSSEYSLQAKLVKFKRPLELPRFQLSMNSGRARARIENRSTQANLDRECKANFGAQTDLQEFVKYSAVQAKIEPNLAGKKLQTRLFKQCDSETAPIFIPSPNKSTNTRTHCYTPYVDRQTQFFEYISEGDLFCLDWINKHLFPIDLNPRSLIVDRKLRDVSEVCTKSTLFSQFNLRNYQAPAD